MENTVASTQTSALAMEEPAAHKDETFIVCSKTEEVTGTGRAEVDTSVPFESVKEVVDRFGGSAIWKSQIKQLFPAEKLYSIEELELISVQKQAAQLKNDLIIKERETLEVLKELERAKRTVDSLKLRLHEASHVDKFHETCQDVVKLYPVIKHDGDVAIVDSVHEGMHGKHSPGSISVELEKAKMKLSRTTSTMANEQDSIESLKSEIQEVKTLLEKTHEKLSSKRAIISHIENDLRQMYIMLRLTKQAKATCNGDPTAFSVEIKDLIYRREQFWQAAEAAKLEVLGLASEIAQIKAKVKAAEIRCLAAKKMEQAAKAAESVAIAQTLVLTNNSNSSIPCLANHEAVVLSIEEYAAITCKIEGADESSTKKIEAAMLEVERANQSKLELIAKIEKAEADVKSCRKFLEEARIRADAANSGKLAVEEALRRWRAENAQRRRCIDGNTKFKNPYPGLHRRDHRMLELSGLNMVGDDACELKHSLSIGEILSRKLMGPEDFDYDAARTEFSNGKIKISLGQILNRKPGALSPENGCGIRNQHSSKRKKLGFMGFPQLLKNGRMKRKKYKKKHMSVPS